MSRAKVGAVLIAALLQTMIWVVLLQADPFGMSTAADRASEDIFLRLYPVLYPGNAERIEVVLLREDQLPLTNSVSAGTQASAEWPPTYEEFADLIRRISAQRPKGIFVDILFDTAIEEAGPIKQLIAERKPGDPPLIFADYADSNLRMLPEIRALPFDGRSALRGVVDQSARANHYQLTMGSAGASPAAVLYNATQERGNRLDLRTTGEFLLAWGNTLRAADASDAQCAMISEADPLSRWRALTDAVWAGLAGMVPGSRDLMGAKNWERMQPCPYHPVLFGRQLYRGDTSIAADRIRDAYVFVGADIAGSGDTVVSPVHGQLPGVFLHAMALDNLLKFKGAAFVESSGLWVLQSVVIFACTLLGGIVFSESREAVSSLAATRHLAISAFTWVVALIVILFVMILFVLALRWAPYNWGGIAAIAFAVCFANGSANLFTVLFGSDRR